MAKGIKGITIEIGGDTKGLDSALKGVNAQSRDLQKELRSVDRLLRFNPGNIELLNQRQAILTSTIQSTTDKLQTLRTAQAQVEEQFRNGEIGEEQYRAFRQEIIATEGRLEHFEQQLRDSQSELRRFSESAIETGNNMKKIGDATSKVGKDLSKNITLPIVAAGALSAKAAIDFESAFAGVRKTVDTTEEGFAKLEQGIRDMAKELPASASDIAAVAESAGQLGIAEDKILSFSRTIIDLGESTNLTREQAATEFARFANIVGMSQDQFSKLGSSVVGLGNTMATTEAEIVSMGMRLAAQGAQVGMSEAQIMALAGTMSSLGIQAEMGGTAMTTILKKINSAVGDGGKGLKAFADAAGVSSKEFADAWNGDPITALDMFVKGLDNSSKEGKNLANILGDLGIKGVYESDVLLRMAGASDLLAQSVATSTKAWEEDVALSEEAAQRYETTASQLAMLRNKIVDVAITLGNILIPAIMKVVDAIEPWIEKFAALSESTQKTIMVIAGIAAALGPVLVAIGFVVSAIGSIFTAIGTLTGAIAVVTGGVTAATPAIGALASVISFLTGPVGIAIGLIVGIGAALVVAYKKIEWFRNGVNSAWENIKSKTVTVFNYVKDFINTAINEIVNLSKDVLAKFSGYWETNGASISKSVSHYFGLMKDRIAEILQVIKGLFEMIWPTLSAVVITTWATIKTVVLSAVDIILGVIQTFSRVLEGDWKGAWQSIVGIAESIIENVVKSFANVNLEQLGTDMVQGFINGFLTMFGTTQEVFMEQFELLKTNIIEKLTSTSTVMTEKLEGWKTAIVEWFTSIPETMSASFTTWETAITTWFSSIPGIIIAKLLEWGNALRDWTIAQNEENKRQFSEWGTVIVEWFTSIPSVITTKLGEWGKAIGDWFTQSVEGIKTQLGNWGNAISTWFTEMPGKITTAISEWWKSISTWFDQTKENIKTKLGEWGTNISKWFTEMPGKITTSLGTWWEAMGKWFSEIPARMTAKFEEWWKAIKAWFASVPKKPEVKNMGKEMVDKVADGNEEKKSEFMDKLGKIVVDVALGALAVAGVALIATGREIISRIIDGIQAMKASLDIKMGELITSIISKVTNSAADMLKAGKDVVDGLIKGIGSKFTAVRNKIEELAGLIPDWAKKVLGIKSPARKMIPVGEDTIEGQIVGMEARREKLEQTMKDIQLSLLDVTDHYADEEKKIIAKKNEDIAKIEKRSKEDVDKIYRAAAAKKRKTTKDENIRIQRIQEDAAKKIADIEKKAIESGVKLLREADKEKLKEIKLFVDDKKSLEELTLQEEAEIWKESAKLFEDGTKEKVATQQAYKKTLEEISKSMLDDVKSYIEDKKSMEELSLVDEANIWEESIKLFEDGTKEKIDAQKAYKNAVEAVNKEITSINKEFEGEMQKINENLVKQIDDLRKAEEDALNKRQNSLLSFKGIFDAFDWEEKSSGEDLLGNLQTQVDGFKIWQEEIEKLSNKAIDEGLLAELREMGPKALPELLALNSLTEEQLTEYSDLYREKMVLAREQAEAELVGMKMDTEAQIIELRKMANKQLGALQDDWTKRIKAVNQATTDEFKNLSTIGKQAGQNLLDGLSSMQGALVDKARSIAKAVNDALQGSLGGSADIPVIPPMKGYAEGFGPARSSTITTNNTPTIVNNYYQAIESPSELARKQTQNMRNAVMDW